MASSMQGECVVQTPSILIQNPGRALDVLRQLQVLLASARDATLADVEQLIQCIQAEFGMDASLEDIIQTLVVRQLEAQYVRRQTPHTCAGAA